MEPAELDEYLKVLRGNRALELDLSWPDGRRVSVKLAPDDGPGAPIAPFVDKNGQPVNLDDGAPWNARDPIEEANFPGKGD